MHSYSHKAFGSRQYLSQSRKKAILEGVQKQRRRRSIITIVIVVVLISLITVGIYGLTVNQNEQRQVIPANVGVSESCVKALHTHDATGTIHVETDENRDYTVGDFFLMWGKVFNSSGVFPYSGALPSYLDHCVSGSLLYHSHPTLTIILKKDAPRTISMTINGNPEPLLQNYVFPRDTTASPANIAITYGPGVPASF